MLTVDEALALVLAECRAPGPQLRPLADAAGLVLATSVASDVDSPPFDKALVDGYAVRLSDVTPGPASLLVREQVFAGDVPRLHLEPGCTARVMTGAPIPLGTEAMVMHERTEPDPADPQRVTIHSQPLRHGLNWLPRAASVRGGMEVVAAGRRLRPVDLGVLAESGAARVSVLPPPRATVLSTGDELVPPDVRPAPGQIRNSNGPYLAAWLASCGAQVLCERTVGDQEEALRAAIARGLEHDLLVLSGGVSAGDKDLVPKLLLEAGVRPIFHKLKLKPGKPLWFGVREHSGRRTLVFGLPGNPVSVLVCGELFLRPAIDRLGGGPGHGLRRESIPLAADFSHRGDRPTFHPARREMNPAGQLAVHPLDWRGSADLYTIAQADGLIAFPAGDRDHRAGEPVDVLGLP